MSSFCEQKVFEFNIDKGIKFVNENHFKIFGTPIFIAICFSAINYRLSIVIFECLITFPFLYFGYMHNKKSAHKLIINFSESYVDFFMINAKEHKRVKFNDINKIYYNNYLLFYTSSGEFYFKDTTNKNSVICAAKIKNLTWGFLSFLGNVSKREIQNFTE